MTTIIGHIDLPNEKIINHIYFVISSGNKITLCRNCGIIFDFELGDIDHTKALPHATCPNCQHEVQLHSKYYKRNS